MSRFANNPWYSEGSRLVRRVDRWVSQRARRPEIGKESDWLGWDGWVRTDDALELLRAKAAVAKRSARTASPAAAPRSRA